MEMEINDANVVSPSQYLAMARRWWWALLLVPLLAGATAWWFSSQQKPTYRATATLFVDSATDSSGDVQAAKLLSKTYASLVASEPVLENVVAKLGLQQSPAALRPRISARNLSDTQIIEVSANDPDASTAAAVANATAESFAEWVAAQDTVNIEESSRLLEQSIEQARVNVEQTAAELATLRGKTDTATPLDQARISTLVASLEQYQDEYNTLRARQGGLGLSPTSRVIVTAPAVGVSTSGPLQPIRDAVLAFTLAFALALVSIVLFERTVDAIRSAEDVHRRVNARVLGSIPRVRHEDRLEVVAAPHSAVSESFRSLRTNLQLTTDQRGPGALVVTSPEPTIGRSLVAGNLAVAMAQAGHVVVLVDGDMRRPYQHVLFGVENNGGVSKILASYGRSGYQQPGAYLETMLVPGPVRGLRLLVAGESPYDPAELLTGAKFAHLVAELKTFADVIVIDSPPVEEVSDALLLASTADTAVVVAEADQTRAATLRSTLASLKQTNVGILGTVLYGVGKARRQHSYMSPAVAPEPRQVKSQPGISASHRPVPANNGRSTITLPTEPGAE